MGMKVLDLFAGCGGFAKGFEDAGFIIKDFIEIWDVAIKTHNINFPDSRLVYKDIYDVKEENLDYYDVVIGGPPCQGFSLAGKRRREDKRNILWMQYLKVVDIVKPKICVMENVLGILSMKNQEGKFVIKEIFNQFKKRGYKVQAKILCSSNYGVPQKRRRVIIVANKTENEFKYPEYVKKKIFLLDIFNLPYKEIEKIQHVYEKNYKIMKKAGYMRSGDNIYSFGSAGRKLGWGLAPTITKSARFIHPKYNRIISVRESARIQSFNDDFMFEGSKRDMYGQIGNAVPVKMAKAIGMKVMECLRR